LINLVIAVMVSFVLLGGSAAQADSTMGVQTDMARLPLSFIPNAGQINPTVRFQTKLANKTILFSPETIVFNTGVRQNETVSMGLQFLDANAETTIEGGDQLFGVANFIQGDDPAQWHTKVPTYQTITYQNLYPGIDLTAWGTDTTLESQFQVAPGADSTLILLEYGGVQKDGGALVLPGPIAMVAAAPVTYQEINGQRVSIESDYRLSKNGQIGFVLGSYDKRYPLMIDLTLTYAAASAGSSNDYGRSIAVDDVGNAYITGTTASANFPTVHPIQTTPAGGPADVFVTKLASDGSQVLYSTYLGGGWFDEAQGITVDDVGAAYVVGTTTSPDFPTVYPVQADIAGSADAFVAKLSASGDRLLYSTYLGGAGTDSGHDIAVNSAGLASVIGQTDSSNFPTKNALQPAIGGSVDTFVAKLNVSGDELVYATYLGGTGDDPGNGIAVDSTGAAHVTGTTTSSDFPTVSPVQSTYGGSFDAFVAELNPTGDILNYATYLGGSGTDFGHAIAVDSNGLTYITGVASREFPTKNSLQPYGGGTRDAFIARFNDGELVSATYLGGSGHDRALGIAVDSEDAVYVTGATTSPDLLSENTVQPVYGGAFDTFVMKLNRGGNALLYTTYLGGNSFDSGNGIAVAANGSAYVVGETISTNYPTKNALQGVHKGGVRDAFVTRLNATGSDIVYSTYLGGRDRVDVQLTELDGEMFEWWNFLLAFMS